VFVDAATGKLGNIGASWSMNVLTGSSAEVATTYHKWSYASRVTIKQVITSMQIISF
jgi:hypothetical protein